jgi:hypothetical protein
MCGHRQQFQCDEYRSAVVVVLIFFIFIQQWFRAGHAMNAAVATRSALYAMGTVGFWKRKITPAQVWEIRFSLIK